MNIWVAEEGGTDADLCQNNQISYTEYTVGVNKGNLQESNKFGRNWVHEIIRNI